MKRKFIKTYISLILSVATICSVSSVSASAKVTPNGFSVVDNTNPKYEEYTKQNNTKNMFKDGKIVSPNIFKSTKGITPYKRGVDAKYDPRELGLTTPVKDQMYLGTCWDFGAIANVETSLKYKGEQTYDFSEEHLRWWAMPDENGIGWEREDGDGGFELISSGYLTSWVGPKFEKDIPYYGYEGGTKPANFASASVAKNVTGLVFNGDDQTELKNSILKYGSIDTGYYHSDYYFNEDTNGYYCGSSYGSPNHEILVVGWDDNYSKDNFLDKPSKDGAWLCKNSWGTSWGDDGYFWVSYEDKFLLSAEYNYNVSVTGIKDVNPNQKVYQYDPYGIIDVLAFTSGGLPVTNLGYANVYDFDDEYNKLDSVMFMSESQGADYEVAYAPFTNGTIDLSKKVVLKTGTVPYVGYVTVDTDGYEVPKGKGAIIVTIDGEKVGCEASVGLEETYYGLFTAEAYEGESFYIYDGEVYDLNDGVTNSEDGYSLSIKAITSNGGASEEPVLSSDSSLSKLSVNNVNVLDRLDENNTVNLTVSKNVSTAYLKLAAADSKANILSVGTTGIKMNAVTVSVPLPNKGVTKLPIVVQAEDGTKTTYNVRLVKLAFGPIAGDITG